MGDIFFKCPGCMKQLVVEDQAAGRGIHCPKCSAPVRVPHPVPAAEDDAGPDAGDEPCRLVRSELLEEEGLAICKGVIRNFGDMPEAFVRVEIDWVDDAGAVIGSDWTFAVSAGELQSGETVQFAFSSEFDRAPPGYRLRVTRG